MSLTSCRLFKQNPCRQIHGTSTAFGMSASVKRCGRREAWSGNKASCVWPAVETQRTTKATKTMSSPGGKLICLLRCAILAMDITRHISFVRREDALKHLMKYLIDFAVLVLLYASVFFKKWKIKGKDILLVNTLMYIYLSFVLYFTLMPVITSIPFVFNHPYTPMNMVPFIDVSMGRGDFLRQVVLNIIMTIPFGFLFPLTQNKTAKFGKSMLCCFLMSLGIELLQPLINGSRSSDITDLITNMIGGVLGYSFYVLFRPITFWILNHLKTKKTNSRFIG